MNDKSNDASLEKAVKLMDGNDYSDKTINNHATVNSQNKESA